MIYKARFPTVVIDRDLNINHLVGVAHHECQTQLSYLV
jgi:hypothetical protein